MSEIVFEDLHGNPDGDNQSVEVDLTAKDGGIARIQTPEKGADKTLPDSSGIEVEVQKDGDKPGETENDFGSTKFRKRLAREQAAKQRATTRAEAAEARAAKAEKQLRDNRRAERAIDKDDVTRQITTAEEQLEEAIEKGNSKDQVRLTKELAKLQGRLIAADYVDDDDPDDGPDDTPRRPERNEALEEWLDGPGDWFDQKGHLKETRAAKALDKELAAEGFDPNEPEYFEELDSRLKERFPKLYDDSEDETTPAPRRESPVAGVGDGATGDQESASKRGNKVVLTPADIANMERFGLDPNDPDVLKEYAMNKRQSDAEAAQ